MIVELNELLTILFGSSLMHHDDISRVQTESDGWNTRRGLEQQRLVFELLTKMMTQNERVH